MAPFIAKHHGHSSSNIHILLYHSLQMQSTKTNTIYSTTFSPTRRPNRSTKTSRARRICCEKNIMTYGNTTTNWNERRCPGHAMKSSSNRRYRAYGNRPSTTISPAINWPLSRTSCCISKRGYSNCDICMLSMPSPKRSTRYVAIDARRALFRSSLPYRI